MLRVLTSISGAYWSNQSPCAHYFIIHFIGLCISNCASFKQFCGATASTLHVKFTYSCCSFTCSTCTPRPTLLGGMRRSSRQSIPSNKKLEGCESTALLDARIIADESCNDSSSDTETAPSSADTEAAQEEGQNQIESTKLSFHTLRRPTRNRENIKEKEKLRRPTRYHQNIKEKAKFSRKDAAKTNSNDHDDLDDLARLSGSDGKVPSNSSNVRKLYCTQGCKFALCVMSTCCIPLTVSEIYHKRISLGCCLLTARELLVPNCILLYSETMIVHIIFLAIFALPTFYFLRALF